MTLQMLEYFIAVAQYQNFTHAAQACHVTQPALSRAIQMLEEELGCSLLVRAGRIATLTEEGEVCLMEAKKVLQQCERLTKEVREAGRRNQRPLRVGYLIVSQLNAFVQYLSSYGAETLPFNLETVYGTTAETKDRLCSGEVDVVLLPEPCIVDLEDTEWVRIIESGLYAIIHKANPLYEQEELNLAELKDQSFVMWSEKTLPLLHAAHLMTCQESGFMPRIVGEGEKMGDILIQVRLHNGVALSTQISSAMYTGDCRFIPVTDSPKRFGLACVWRKEDPSLQLGMLKRILTAAREKEKP